MNLIERILAHVDWPAPAAMWLGRAEAGAKPWGDGLADLSLTSFMASCSWEDVAPDELAFLMPALVGRREAAGRERLAGLVHGAYVAHAFLAMHAISNRERISLGQSMEALWARGLAIGLQLRDVCEEGPQAVVDLGLADADGARRAAALVPYLSTSLGVAIRCLERALQELSGPLATTAPKTPLQLSEALELSLYSGLNAAYLHPEHAWAHELLLSGAWLGHLSRGRPAYLPSAVASCLVDHLGSGRSRPADDPVARCGEVLALHADLVIGRGRLLGIAARVATTGHPALVRPLLAGQPANRRHRSGIKLRQ